MRDTTHLRRVIDALGGVIEVETIGEAIALVCRDGWHGYECWYVLSGDARTIRDTYGRIDASAECALDQQRTCDMSGHMYVVGVGDVTESIQRRAARLARVTEHQTVVHAYAQRLHDGRVCLIDPYETRASRWLVIPCAG